MTTRKLEHMNGRLFNMEEIPVLKMRREYGSCDGPATLEFHLGNNYIYIGSQNKGLKLPESPLAAKGKGASEYRRWIWKRICAKDEAVLNELGKVVLVTSIAHWPEELGVAEVVMRAADWVRRYTKPEPDIISDLDYSGQFGEKEFGWDGYANTHEVLYHPYRTSSLYDDYDEAWEAFVALPPAIHVSDICGLALSKAEAMTICTWKDEFRREALINITNGWLEGGKRSLLTMFPNHGWCVSASDPEKLLDDLIRDFGGGWN